MHQTPFAWINCLLTVIVELLKSITPTTVSINLKGTTKEEILNLAKPALAAKETLVSKTGAGNDFLGWIDWAVNYDKEEYARIIDDFFDMYGYKTCRVKTPNSNHRENWWYTKTVNANITGNVPNDAMNKIKQAYNDGLTFWKNPANFLNYSVSNGII